MENSKIEWCHHTFNSHWGCVKVSPGCEHCYAEGFSKRTGHNIWGPAKTTDRRLFGDKHWAEPLKWNQKAKEAGERHRVFCASMGDVFEDHPQLVDARRRLLDLIVHTPHLDWLLLTKRPENVNWMIEQATGFSESSMWFHAVGDHVWIGTSVENQEQADKRIPHLLEVPAAIRFLSCEPLLGHVNISGYLQRGRVIDTVSAYGGTYYQPPSIHWVIVGAESGHHARPMNEDWVRSLRDQCTISNVAFFYKQNVVNGKKIGLPELDGRQWSEFPKVSLCHV